MIQLIMFYIAGKEDSQEFITKLNQKLTEEHRDIIKVSKMLCDGSDNAFFTTPLTSNCSGQGIWLKIYLLN